MALHAEWQRLDALKEEPGIVGTDTGAKVPKRNGTHAKNIGEWGKRLREIMTPAETVIGFVRVIEEGMFATGPVEFTGVDNDTAKSSAVAAEPFC